MSRTELRVVFERAVPTPRTASRDPTPPTHRFVDPLDERVKLVAVGGTADSALEIEGPLVDRSDRPEEISQGRVPRRSVGVGERVSTDVARSPATSRGPRKQLPRHEKAQPVGGPATFGFPKVENAPPEKR